MIVADASVLVPALLDSGGSGALARERLLADDVAVPELADVEVLSGSVDVHRGAAALGDYAELALDRFPYLPLLPRAWELRDAVSAYDAQYVALAELLGVPLLTADRRLSRAPGPRCAVELLG